MNTLTKYMRILVNLTVYILGVFLIIFVLPKVIVFFMPFVIGWVISMIANPMVRFMEGKLKIVRKHSSMLLIIGTIALIVVICYFTFVKLGSEVITVINHSEEIYTNISKEMGNINANLSDIYDKFPKNIRRSIADAVVSLNDYILNFIGNLGEPTMQAAGNFAKNIPATLIYIIVTILSSYFFIAQRDKIILSVRNLAPPGIYEKSSIIIRKLKDIVGGYFKAQFKIMIIVAGILLVGLSVLQTDYALLLALLISFLDFLPFFGTGTVLIPWGLIKLLSGDYRMALGLFILYGVSQLVRQLIQPKIVGDTIGLDPLLTLLFLYIGYRLGGIAGMILAVPIGMIIISLYKLGLFNQAISDIKTIITDINNFRKKK